MNITFYLTLLIAISFLSGCGGSPNLAHLQAYEEALQQTDPDSMETLAPESPEADAAIQRFTDFFTDLTVENVRAMAPQVYAEDAFFYDTLLQHRGADEIEAYFVKTAQNTEQVTVTMLDVARSRGDYYFRWKMSVAFKDLHDSQLTPSVGMTHIRFNKEGKVVLHYDYWDTSVGFLEYIPVVGWLIRQIKSRI